MTVMSSRASRRTFLTGAGAAAAIATLPRSAYGAPGLRTAADALPGLAANPSFPQGVMAGVPRTDGATLWTRVEPSLLAPNPKLALVVSANPDLSSPVVVKPVTAVSSADGTVHEDLQGLPPGKQWFYQFRGKNTSSPVGRFQTLRPADSMQPVRIGFFTCQGFEEGYYAAHRHLAEEDLDLVVCLGDYVYEFTTPGVRGIELNAYPQGLGGMRAKYPHYRSDQDLQAMHSQHAFLPIWDDHEFRNNYDKEGWTFPLLSDLDSLLFFQQKKQWAWQAWFEHMPVPRFAGDPTRTYRSLRLGGMAELFLQDARQYRDDQGCGDNLTPIQCADADAPGRTVLGATQKQWLVDGISGSSARWKVMANANMMMGMVTDDAGARAYMDTWDGYGAERTEILSTLGQRGVENLVVITGDDHDSFGGELWDTGFAPGTSGSAVNPAGSRRVGTEFLVPSITSHNTGDTGVPAARLEEQNRLAHNPHLQFIDMVQHGYGVIEATASELTMRYRQVDKLDRQAGVSTSYTFTVPNGQATIEG